MYTLQTTASTYMFYKCDLSSGRDIGKKAIFQIQIEKPKSTFCYIRFTHTWPLSMHSNP